MSRRLDKVAAASALAGLAAETSYTNAPDQQDKSDHYDTHRQSEHVSARGSPWSTVQQQQQQQQSSHHSPSHRPSSHSPAYLGRGLPHAGSEAQQHHISQESRRMPDDSSPPGYLYSPPTQRPPPRRPHYHHFSQRHASQHLVVGDSNSPYTSSSGDRSRSHGSPRSPTGSLDRSQSPPDDGRGADPADSAYHQNEPLGPSSLTADHSPSRRRTRVLMTRIQSGALNKLWSQTMFPSTSEREVLAQQIGLTARQVQVWFQNQRQKRRRERESDEVIPQHELSPDSHPTGWMSSPVAPTYLPYQPTNRLGQISRSTYPPPSQGMAASPQHISHHMPHLISPLRSATHPPLVRPGMVPLDYRRVPSPSYLSPQGIAHNSELGGGGNAAMPSAWRHRSPRSDIPIQPGGPGPSTRGSGDSPPIHSNTISSRDPSFGPHRPSRRRSTSQISRWPYQPSVSPPSASRPPLPGTSAQGFPFSTPSRPLPIENPNMGPRRRTDGSAFPKGNQGDDMDPALNFRPSKSAPARSSGLPPSLSSIVIDSPYETGAGPEATKLKPFNVHEGHDDEAVPSPRWTPSQSQSHSHAHRHGERHIPRPSLVHRSSSGDDEGSTSFKRVADLLN